MLIWQLLASLQERERELAVNLHGLVRQKKNDGKTMGKPWENCDLYGKSPFLMGKLTISMAIFKFANCNVVITISGRWDNS
jgi:hypothetical protein